MGLQNYQEIKVLMKHCFESTPICIQQVLFSIVLSNIFIDVISFIAKADIEFTFPVESQEEEELRLIFNWSPAKMSNLPFKEDETGTLQFEDPPIEVFPAQETPEVELLLFALPHHQERMRTTMESSNQVKDEGCMPTIHGIACPVSTAGNVSKQIINLMYGWYRLRVTPGR